MSIANNADEKYIFTSLTLFLGYDDDRLSTGREEMDDLHDHAAAHSKVAMTIADWRKVMMDALGPEPSFHTRERYQQYRDAGVPEQILQDMDMIVFYAARGRKNLREKSD